MPAGTSERNDRSPLLVGARDHLDHMGESVGLEASPLCPISTRTLVGVAQGVFPMRHRHPRNRPPRVVASGWVLLLGWLRVLRDHRARREWLRHLSRFVLTSEHY